ncbi:magnesium transporter [Cytophagales bacterium LB-30]|uniref:Magnesium transporter MgtE n=1 Tax=Shiella aurantiaca TaxID=3058365 RepID=A0ABT8F3V9_9BACT|nr:magnesium transporter [Shiella aurantiaca]MDN4164954.1 magnesium transporter [Shiella aurantiaca]
MEFELSKEYAEWLKSAIENQDTALIAESMANANPTDISSLLYEFNTQESKYIIELVPKEVGASIINHLDEDTRTKFLKNFTPQEIAQFIDYLDSDDAVDILNELPLVFREETIGALEDEEQSRYIQELLRYDEHTAGGLMAKELIKANINWTIVQCIDEIRRQAENVQKIYSVYVVDQKGKLLGRVSLKKIILAEDHAKIADIYDPEIITVESHMEEREVADIMQKYDLEAVPVVNLQGKLIGRITIDDILDVITDIQEEERQIMAGISEDVEEDDSVWMLTRARLPWLIIGIFGGLIAAEFYGLFEGDIAIIPALALFTPLITATGGNVGIQSSSIILQSLANKSAFEESFFQRIFRMILVAFLNGIVIASIVFGVVLLLGKPFTLAAVVGLALFSVVILASFLGTITPLILDRLGFNPALAAGPFITTANDLLGLAVYFSVAHLLYSL